MISTHSNNSQNTPQNFPQNIEPNSLRNTPDNSEPNRPKKLNEKPYEKPLLKISVALVGLILTLVMVNFGINKYETHLATGNEVLLELAPVDPRGMMQGDYMALEFALGNEIFDIIRDQQQIDNEEDIFNHIYDYSADGIAIIKKDQHGVGHLVRLISIDELEKQALAVGELPIYYRVRNGRVKFATNAYFFQEGHASAYEDAEYGRFVINDKGEPLLTDMVNEKFEVIKVEQTEQED